MSTASNLLAYRLERYSLIVLYGTVVPVVHVQRLNAEQHHCVCKLQQDPFIYVSHANCRLRWMPLRSASGSDFSSLIACKTASVTPPSVAAWLR